MGFTSAGLWQDNGLTPILDIFNNYCINTNSVNVWHGAIQTPKEDPGMCRTCLCEDVCMDDSSVYDVYGFRSYRLLRHLGPECTQESHASGSHWARNLFAACTGR